MEINFTQGNWEINPKASRNVRCGNITIANCSSGQDGEREEEEIANAKLIAAAPDIFKSLKECLDGVCELNGEFQDGWDDVIERAQQALKKATK